MNRYGHQAMKHWQEFDPSRYAEIGDPEAFFTQLGEEVQAEIIQRSMVLAGPDRPGESYLQKVGRLNMARFTAESEVLRELVLIPDPEDEEEQEAPLDGWRGELAAKHRRERQQEQDELDAETTRTYRVEE